MTAYARALAPPPPPTLSQVQVFLTAQDYRPHLLVMRRCHNVLIHNLRFQNSPQYHMFLADIADVVVRYADRRMCHPLEAVGTVALQDAHARTLPTCMQGP